MSQPDLEVVKWYTRARKFPQLIGKTPDGARIWGGPYTLTQAAGAGVLLLVGINTMGLWARYGLIGNAVLLLGGTYVLTLALGRIPVGSRSPLAVTTGLIRAVSSPRTGTHAGRRLRVARPTRQRRHTLLLGPDQAPPVEPVPAGAAASAGAASASPSPPSPSPPSPLVSEPLPYEPLPNGAAGSTVGPAAAHPAAPVRGELTGVQQLLAGLPAQPEHDEPAEAQQVPA